MMARARCVDERPIEPGRGDRIFGAAAWHRNPRCLAADQYVLEGSVRKAGTTVPVTAQLIDAQADQHLWSQTFDRPLTSTPTIYS